MVLHTCVGSFGRFHVIDSPEDMNILYACALLLPNKSTEGN